MFRTNLEDGREAPSKASTFIINVYLHFLFLAVETERYEHAQP